MTLLLLGKSILVVCGCVAVSHMPLGAAEGAPLVPMAGDTPEKLANPDSWNERIEALKERTPWTQYATPEQIQMFNDSEEEDWSKSLPRGEYDTTGLNQSLLGSKVPPPGVHPRIYFSPEDLPAIRKRFQTEPLLKKRLEQSKILLEEYLLKPETQDGRIFAKLAAGDTDDLELPEGGRALFGCQFLGPRKKSLQQAGLQYWPFHLSNMAFYALVTGDEKLGKDCANAICNFYKLLDPKVDQFIAENPLNQDYWRSVRDYCGGEPLGVAYDKSAPYMTAEQKEFMRSYIAKVTKGRRGYGQNAPLAWRNHNWIGWDMPHFITALAIEGQEGFDAEVYRSGVDTIEAFFTFGISPQGTITETNGKNGAGFMWMTHAAIAAARRGDNFLGHPHLKKLAAAQAAQVTPAGGENFNNGTWGRTSLFGQGELLAALYPENPVANWLIRQGAPDPEELSVEAYREVVRKGPDAIWKLKNKNAGPQAVMGPTILFDAVPFTPGLNANGEPRKPWEREHLGLPLDFHDPHHGLLSTRSGNEKDALMMVFESRSDLIHGGHQHHAAGHFYLAADGVNWGWEAHDCQRGSETHSLVMIDGVGQGEHENSPSPARAKWMGATINENGALATTDQKHAYDYIWGAADHHTWMAPEVQKWKWEPEMHPDVFKFYKGTHRYKCRMWAAHWTDSPWSPTMRAPYNPVEYAFRTAGVIRGGHPYAIVSDDLKKDGEKRRYAWRMQLPEGVRLIPVGGLHALVQKGMVDAAGEVKAGTPGLLVVNAEGRTPQVKDDVFKWREGKEHPMRYLEFSANSDAASFRVVLIPFRWGEELPVVSTGTDNSMTLAWADQQDEVVFAPMAGGPAGVRVKRNGNEVLNHATN